MKCLVELSDRGGFASDMDSFGDYWAPEFHEAHTLGLVNAGGGFSFGWTITKQGSQAVEAWRLGEGRSGATDSLEADDLPIAARERHREPPAR